MRQTERIMKQIDSHATSFRSSSEYRSSVVPLREKELKDCGTTSVHSSGCRPSMPLGGHIRTAHVCCVARA